MNNWLFFSLLGPFLWGITTVFDGALLRNYIKSEFAKTWFSALTRLPFILLFFWIGGIHFPSLPIVFWVMLAGLFWLSTLIFNFRALTFEEPSRVAVFIQMAPLFTLLIAFFVLGETLGIDQLFAFVLLLGGGVLAALKKLQGLFQLSKAFYLVMVSSFFGALSGVMFKHFEPEFVNFFSAFAIYFLGGFLGTFLLIFRPSHRKKVLKHFKNLPLRAWLMLVFTEFFGTVGVIAFVYALTLGKASLTMVMLGTQPLFALIAGIILSRFVREVRKEDMRKNVLLLKGASFVLIIAGLVLLQL